MGCDSCDTSLSHLPKEMHLSKRRYGECCHHDGADTLLFSFLHWIWLPTIDHLEQVLPIPFGKVFFFLNLLFLQNLPSFATLTHASKSSSHFLESPDSLLPWSIAEQIRFPRSISIWRTYTTQKGGCQRRLGSAHITTGNFNHIHQIVFFTQT